QRSSLSVRLRDFRPAVGRPPIPLPSEGADDVVDALEIHTIHRLRGGTLRHRSGVPVDFTVSTKEQLRVEQLLVDTLQRESSRPSVAIDVQERFGFLHHAYLRVLDTRLT